MKAVQGIFAGILVILAGFFVIGAIDRNMRPEADATIRVVDRQPVNSDKRILIVFTAKWCLPCGRLERNTLADPNVKSQLANYQVRTVDVDHDKATAAKYGVVKWPTYLVEDGNGKVIKRGEGYRPPGSFLQWLNN
jgi:thiol:disulfide interchange protein